MFQSTHPHGVRPGMMVSQISSNREFQSTHPHGVRPFLLRSLPALRPFQSTHPHGVRPALNTLTDEQLDVSIHAPARGATFKPVIGSLRVTVFQSTHPHGVRRRGGSYLLRLQPGFNPRTRTGCDCQRTRRHIKDHRFNPRTRTGCDGGSVELYRG